MGVDLMLKYGEEHIANLGRSYNYKIGNEFVFDYGRLKARYEDIKNDILTTLTKQASYVPKTYAELTEILYENDSLVEYWVDELINIGKSMTIAEILDRENDAISVVEV